MQHKPNELCECHDCHVARGRPSPTAASVASPLTQEPVAFHLLWLALSFTVHRYLMSNAHGRWDGAEKAMRHQEMCSYFVAAFRGVDVDSARREHEDLYQEVHAATQHLTDNLDTAIGFPLWGRPDYDDLAPKFFAEFYRLAVGVLTPTAASVASPLTDEPVAERTRIGSAADWWFTIPDLPIGTKLYATPQAAASVASGGETVPQWIDDPHDIEQGQILNPAWLKLHGLTAQQFAATAQPQPRTPDDAASDIEPLSARLRPGIECAPWVIEAVRKLEAAAQPSTPAEPVTDTTWCAYIAGMIETYLGFNKPQAEREKAIAGIIERRLPFLLAVQPHTAAEPSADTLALDWLEQKVVNVRTPLRHGSGNLFWSTPEDQDGEVAGPSDLRAEIARRIATAKDTFK